MSSALKILLRPSVLAAVGVVALVCLLRLRLERGRFWCLILGTLAALGLGELACRAVGLGGPARFIAEETPATALDARCPYEPDSKLVYTYPDNPRGYFDARNRVVGHINSLGFRGREPSPDAREDRVRICVVGDSFVLGFGVLDEDTLPAQLERVLSDRGVDAEVLNFGESSTGTHEHVELLEDFALTFEPDVVVLVVFLNDALDVGTKPILWEPFAFARIREHWHLLNAAMNIIENGVRTRCMVDFYRSGYEDGRLQWRRFSSSISEAGRITRAGDLRLVVAVHPALYRLDGGYPFAGVHGKIAGLCESEGIECVDLLEALEGERADDLKVHRVDHHPNERAHRLSAEFLAFHIIGAGEVLGAEPE